MKNKKIYSKSKKTDRLRTLAVEIHNSWAKRKSFHELVKFRIERKKEKKVEEEAIELDDQLQDLFLDIEQLKKQLERPSSARKASSKAKIELDNKANHAQELIEAQKLLWAQLPLDNRKWLYLGQQSKLNILLDRVKIEPGDALCNYHVAIEGSRVCQRETETLNERREMDFVSFLQFLEACVLHKRIWVDTDRTGDPLDKYDPFGYGYLAPALRAAGVLQVYDGISELTDLEAVQQRMKLYTKTNGAKTDSRFTKTIAISETAKLIYIPYHREIIKFRNFTKNINEQIYQPLLDTVYGVLSKSLVSQFNEIRSYSKMEEVFIPPISAIILNRASKFEEVPEVALETRERFSKIRMALMEYESSLMDTSVSMKKRLKILSDVRFINQELAKPYEYLDSLYINEWPDTWNLVSDLFDGEFSATKLTGKLLGKPLAIAIKKMRLHNVAYLFNVRRKIYTIASHNNIVKKFLPNADMERISRYLHDISNSEFRNQEKAG